MQAGNRSLAWSLAASVALHAGAIAGPLAGNWLPAPPPVPRPYMVEARLTPEKQPEEVAAFTPKPEIRRAPRPKPKAVVAPPEPAPEPEPKAQPEPLARVEEKPAPVAPPAPPPDPLPAPRAVLQANAPEYPPQALAQRIVGCVLAEIHVDDRGRVENIEIAGSTHPGVFDDSVREAYRNNFYLPAEKDGRPVRARVLGIASFELEGMPPLLCEQYFFERAREINARPYP